MIEGFLFVDKPVGISSFKVIRELRKITGVKKIGHAGTLDPFASGLMIVAIGRAYTRQLDRFLGSDKSYRCEMILGKTTTTYDCEGDIVSEMVVAVSDAAVCECIGKFKGSQQQVPPAFSAKKKDGQRAYKAARRGETVVLDPVTVVIHELDVLEVSLPRVAFDVTVSKGTYIRSLVHDIGQALGCGAMANTLCRTAIGSYTLDRAVALDGLTLEMVQDAIVGEL